MKAGKLVFRYAILGFMLVLAFDRADAQNQPAQEPPAQNSVQNQTAPAGGTIHGIVKSGSMPIPGAAVAITLASSDQKISTWTDVDGTSSN